MFDCVNFNDKINIMY